MTFYNPYDEWNKLKKRLAVHQKKVYCSERDIWWCSLGKNIGHEQDGKNALFERPILIIRKFNKYIFLAIPLSTKLKNDQYYHHYFFQDSEYSAIISQLRVLDSKRLCRKIGRLNQGDFRSIKEKVHLLL